MDFTKPVEDPAKRDYAEFEKAVGAWHEYHRAAPYVLLSPIDSKILTTNSSTNRFEGTLQPQFAAPAYTATTLELIISNPTYGHWGALAELSPAAIVAHLDSIIIQCATGRKSFDHVITTLEIITHMFLAKHRPESSEDRADYLGALAQAQSAGQAIFAPQQAYRDAISSFYVLTADIIDLLPKANVLQRDQQAKYNQIIEAAQNDEEDVRNTFRELTGTKSKGVKGHPLLTYMENARRRWKNWQMEEGQLKALAEETLGALL